MKIIHEAPPNYKQILQVFPHVERMKGVLFCWGDSIYNPSGTDEKFQSIPDALVAHETIHSERQTRKGVEEWWVDYLKSPVFRLEEEIPAHIREYEIATLNHPRNIRRVILRNIAERLSGSLYGNLLRFDDAKKLIKKG